MSTIESAKPVFSNIDEEPLLSKPISKLAIAAMVLGVIGLLSPFTGALLPVPFLAAALGLIGSVMLSRSTSTHSGIGIANIGLFLGLLSTTWFLVSDKANRDNLANSGGEFAAHYLENLADGNEYVVAELQQPFPARQLPGLDLKTYYESYKAAAPSERNKEEAEPDPRMLAKERVQKIREHSVSNYARRFPNASWILSHLQEITNRGGVEIIVVNMINSEDASKTVSIALCRQNHVENGKSLADWFVQDMKLN